MSPLVESIILEGEVHRDAMPSGPFSPDPLPKAKKEKSERILLTAELRPSASNGESVNVIFAGVQRKAMRLVGGAALRLRSFFGSGGGTIRVVSRSGTPAPGEGSVGIQFREGCGSWGVKESEEGAGAGAGVGAGAAFGDLLGSLPSHSSGDSVRAAVCVERDLHDRFSEILADLASAEEVDEAEGGDSGYGGDPDGAEEGKSDTVLITVCNWVDIDGTAYIEMTPVAADEGRREEQDHDVGYAGGRF